MFTNLLQKSQYVKQIVPIDMTKYGVFNTRHPCFDADNNFMVVYTGTSPRLIYRMWGLSNEIKTSFVEPYTSVLNMGAMWHSPSLGNVCFAYNGSNHTTPVWIQRLVLANRITGATISEVDCVQSPGNSGYTSALFPTSHHMGYDYRNNWIVNIVNAWNSVGGYRNRIVLHDYDTGISLHGDIDSTLSTSGAFAIDPVNQWLYIWDIGSGRLRWYDYTNITGLAFNPEVGSIPFPEGDYGHEGFAIDREGNAWTLGPPDYPTYSHATRFRGISSEPFPLPE